jgi:hypothetical protein
VSAPLVIRGMTMTIWPQLIYIALCVLGLGYCIAKEGQPRDPHNLFSSLFGSILVWALLWWGGFFDPLFAK